MRALLVDVLACHRMTKLVTEDVITQPLRAKIFKRWPPSEDKWSYVLTCPWCASIWLGAAVALARRFYPGIWNPVGELLAVSSATGLIAEREANHGSL